MGIILWKKSTLTMRRYKAWRSIVMLVMKKPFVYPRRYFTITICIFTIVDFECLSWPQASPRPKRRHGCFSSTLFAATRDTKRINILTQVPSHIIKYNRLWSRYWYRIVCTYSSNSGLNISRPLQNSLTKLNKTQQLNNELLHKTFHPISTFDFQSD